MNQSFQQTYETKGGESLSATIQKPKAANSSQIARYTELDPVQFENETGKIWETLENVRALVAKHVRDGDVKPVDAMRGLAAFAANVLGYEEFVPRVNDSGSIVGALQAGLYKSQQYDDEQQGSTR